MIKIIIADDYEIVRHGLRSLLSSESDMEIVGEAENGWDVVKLVRELNPQVVIMDISMPDLNGIEATRQIVGDLPGVKVIALSMHCDTLFVLNMFKAGASGYLLKDCALEELVKAVRTVMARRIYLSPGISDVVIKDFISGRTGKDASCLSVLTSREREVLQLVAEGKSTKQMAEKLCVSVKTVETHRKQLMSKLDIHSIAELTKFAIRQGLTPLEA